MSTDDAQREAVARWGPRALVHHERVELADGTEAVLCLVGHRCGDDTSAWFVRGRGASWREAFDDADAEAPR